MIGVPKMFTTYLIIALIALGVGGGGGAFIHSRMSKAEIAQAEARITEAQARVGELEAAAKNMVAAGDLVRQAVSDHLAKTALAADVLSTERAKYLCGDSSLASKSACITFLLCSQVGAGTVSQPACDAAVNEWISERQLEVIEQVDALPALKEERRRTFERRK